MNGFEIVPIPGGGVSLRSLEHRETFHPGVGPMEEAKVLHVAQHRFEERMRAGEEFVIWDVGLGAAANAVAVMEALAGSPAPVWLRSFDKTLEPLRFALEHAGRLDYPARWSSEIGQLLDGGEVRAGELRWTAEIGDFRERVRECTGPGPDAVLFDPYSPKANPEMWTEEIFRALRERADGDCTLTTYSRGTVTRVKLLRAGWCVGRGAATGEKEETTIAATRLELLREPLGVEWLGRVSRSAAFGGEAPGIARELAACPQMR